MTYWAVFVLHMMLTGAAGFALGGTFGWIAIPAAMYIGFFMGKSIPVMVGYIDESASN